jgi:hypothetical protein
LAGSIRYERILLLWSHSVAKAAVKTSHVRTVAMQGLIYVVTEEAMYKSFICAKGQCTRKKSFLNYGDVERNLYFYKEFKSGFDT